MCVPEGLCTPMLRYFLRLRSKLSRSVMISFSSVYSINDVWDNDTDAIRSRIDFVQRNEERSAFSHVVLTIVL